MVEKYWVQPLEECSIHCITNAKHDILTELGFNYMKKILYKPALVTKNTELSDMMTVVLSRVVQMQLCARTQNQMGTSAAQMVYRDVSKNRTQLSHQGKLEWLMTACPSKWKHMLFFSTLETIIIHLEQSRALQESIHCSPCTGGGIDEGPACSRLTWPLRIPLQ